MGPNEKQKIEIEKLHRDPLPHLNQAVTADYSDFLGTALIQTPFSGSGMPHQVHGVLLRAMSGTELSRVRTELYRLRIFTTVAPHPVQPNRQPASHRYLGNALVSTHRQVPVPTSPVRMDTRRCLGCLH